MAVPFEAAVAETSVPVATSCELVTEAMFPNVTSPLAVVDRVPPTFRSIEFVPEAACARAIMTLLSLLIALPAVAEPAMSTVNAAVPVVGMTSAEVSPLTVCSLRAA